MGIAYKNYCHADATAVAASIFQETFVLDGYVQAVNVVTQGSGYSAQLTLRKSLSRWDPVIEGWDSAQSDGQVQIALMTCTDLGPLGHEYPVYAELVEMGFMGMMLLYVAGLAVGLIMSQVRKLRSA